jgi:hypothetical protein
MNLAKVINLVVMLSLLLYQWREKFALLKVTLSSTLPALMFLAVFLGLVSEGRGCLGAYPIASAPLVDSIPRLTDQPRPVGGLQCRPARQPAPRADSEESNSRERHPSGVTAYGLRQRIAAFLSVGWADSSCDHK